MRTILHSDMTMTTYDASVEMILDTKLRGKAIAVCGSAETRQRNTMDNEKATNLP